MLRWLGIMLAVLVLLVLSGLLLADHLTPKAMGTPSSVLPVQPAQTVIDRELARLQASHPGQSGVAFLADGLDAYAALQLPIDGLVSAELHAWHARNSLLLTAAGQW